MHELAGFGVIFFAKTKRVHRGNRAGAHREYVSQDAAHTCGCALVGFDITRVVMAFHFENHGLSVADIDHTCVFSWTAYDLWPFCREGSQPFFGRLVRTVFIPHSRKDAKLREGRLAANDLKDALVFVRRKAMRFDQVWGDGGLGHGSNPCKAEVLFLRFVIGELLRM